jgi:NAD+ diphosphatase
VRRQFVPGLAPSEPLELGALWFVVRGREVLLVEQGGATSILEVADLAAVGLEPEARHYLGALSGRACYAVHVEEGVEPPEGAAFSPLRPALLALEDDLGSLIGLAYQIVDWDRTHRYCGRCGTPTEDAPGERAKRCPACDLYAYPRVSPAVIVRVTRGSQILLARGRRFAEPIYSVLAGFVEPGESLEQTAIREVKEEVGVEISDLEYFGSQPWPFPHSLMVGFTARWAGGEIQIEEAELVDAQWFSADALPQIPPSLSIARRLIDDYIAREAVSR